MIKAGKLRFILFVATASLLFSGCVFNSDDSAENANQRFEMATKNVEPKSVEELVADNVSKDEKPLKLRDLTQAVTLADGSQYVQMKDAEGNKFESRFFPDGSIVRSVIVKTSTDGTTQTFVRSWNGKVEQIEASAVETPWGSSARELALIAGFKKEPPPPQIVQPAVKATPSIEQKQSSEISSVPPPVNITVEPLPTTDAAEKK